MQAHEKCACIMGLFKAVVVSLDSRDKPYGIEISLFLFLAVQIWASYSTLLSFNCKIKIILVSLHRLVLRTIHKVSRAMPGTK